MELFHSAWPWEPLQAPRATEINRQSVDKCLVSFDLGKSDTLDVAS